MIVHVVREVVEVKEVGEKIIADSELREGSAGTSHSGKKASLESTERVPFLSRQIATLEEPLLRLGRHLLGMAVDTLFECTVRREVGDHDLVSWGCR